MFIGKQKLNIENIILIKKYFFQAQLLKKMHAIIRKTLHSQHK